MDSDAAVINGGMSKISAFPYTFAESTHPAIRHWNFTTKNDAFVESLNCWKLHARLKLSQSGVQFGMTRPHRPGCMHMCLQAWVWTLVPCGKHLPTQQCTSIKKTKKSISHAGRIKVNHHMWFISRLEDVGTERKMFIKSYIKVDKNSKCKWT